VTSWHERGDDAMPIERSATGAWDEHVESHGPVERAHAGVGRLPVDEVIDVRRGVGVFAVVEGETVGGADAECRVVQAGATIICFIHTRCSASPPGGSSTGSFEGNTIEPWHGYQATLDVHGMAHGGDHCASVWTQALAPEIFAADDGAMGAPVIGADLPRRDVGAHPNRCGPPTITHHRGMRSAT